jgi:hypothetical protein
LNWFAARSATGWELIWSWNWKYGRRWKDQCKQEKRERGKRRNAEC